VKLLLILLLCVVPLERAKAETFPGKAWNTSADPEIHGWSAAKLAEARTYSEALDTAAVMIVHDGVLIDAWGDIAREYPAASIRKSLLSALYGIQVGKGTIGLSDTLEDLGIEDEPPGLTPEERQARVVDLLMARSGVYHPAAGETAYMKDRRPRRGSHAPGEFWYYNNWDFNVLGTIYETAAQEEIVPSLVRFIAAPLQMQDFDRDDGGYFFEKSSRHPAYYVQVTARDLARFGLLYLKEGRWRDRQVVPAAWVRKSTSQLSNIWPTTYGHADGPTTMGYGYLWWAGRDEGFLPGVDLHTRAYRAYGHRGQYVIVIPARNLVVVHLVDRWDPTEYVSFQQMGTLLSMILDAAPEVP